ncbi:MAG: FAD-dependent oxidoreductase [Deltaproteobacteria bacterium]|nr:FAD-dependent oxidoreductase [Deltaproteobacteria bacterium]
MGTYETLFKPIRIGTMEVKNRFVMAPMVTNYSEKDGSVTDRLVAYHRARAKGGVGLIIVEATYVHPCGKGFSNELGIHKDDLLPGLKKLTGAIHDAGGKIAIQLYHSGRQSYEAVTGLPLIAPSPVPCPVCGGMPKEMTKEDIGQMLDAFGNAARRAKEAGFDAVEIHGAHGYLLNQFLSPYSNQRRDEYGGSFANRARFPLEVLKKVRETVGKDFPVIYRLSAAEHVPGGLTIEDTKAFAGMLVDNGIDAIHVSGGVYQTAAMIIQPAAIPQGVYVDNAVAIKEAISGRVPVIVVGRIKEPSMMEDLVASGKVDMIAMGRGLLADEAFPAKLESGNLTDIRKCIACNQGCIDRLFADVDIGCLGNAMTGREWKYDLDSKAAQKKKVLVAGGGPGGLEAARIAALRGHEVHLYEKSPKLGGLMNYTILAPSKNEFDDLRSFQVGQVEKLGVRVKLGQAVEGNVIDQLKPDVVIMATGSEPIQPDIPGLERLQVKKAEEILAGASFGKNAVVIGGGAVGCETAEFLADRGAKATVIEMLENVARDIGMLEKALLTQRLEEKGVTLLTKTIVREVNPDGNLVLQKEYQQEIMKGVDTVVLAVGYKPVTDLEGVVAGKKVPLLKIGDCVEARKVLDAIWEGFQRAYEL